MTPRALSGNSQTRVFRPFLQTSLCRRSLKMYIAKKFIWQNPQGFAFTSQWGSVILLIGNVPIKVEGKKVLMQWAILNYAHFKKGPFPWPSLLRWFWWTRHDRAKCISWFFCDKVDGSSGAAHIAPHGKQSIKKQKLFTISMESKKKSSGMRIELLKHILK